VIRVDEAAVTMLGYDAITQEMLDSVRIIKGK
jgi:hypothetical protein